MFETQVIFLLSFVVLLSTVVTYPFICPSPAQWHLRSTQLCQLEVNYTCLFNSTDESYVEKCHEPGVIQKGFKLIWRKSLDAGDCSLDRYQPIPFRTNESSSCVFLKSSCNDEGQILVNNGSGSKDAYCSCDNTRGYHFLHTPRNIDFCIPSQEDCTCYGNGSMQINDMDQTVTRLDTTSIDSTTTNRIKTSRLTVAGVSTGLSTGLFFICFVVVILVLYCADGKDKETVDGSLKEERKSLSSGTEDQTQVKSVPKDKETVDDSPKDERKSFSSVSEDVTPEESDKETVDESLNKEMNSLSSGTEDQTQVKSVPKDEDTFDDSLNKELPEEKKSLSSSTDYQTPVKSVPKDEDTFEDSLNKELPEEKKSLSASTEDQTPMKSDVVNLSKAKRLNVVMPTSRGIMEADGKDKTMQIDKINSEEDNEQNLILLLENKREYWRSQQELFYETKFVEEIQKVIRSLGCHSILLTGTISSGKSVTAAHIALNLEASNYAIFFIRNPNEFEKIFNPEARQVFVIDDPFGKQIIDTNILCQWEKLFKKIENGLKESTKIITTMRKRLFSMNKPRLEESFVWKTNFEMSIMSKERSRILEKHRFRKNEKYRISIAAVVLEQVEKEEDIPQFFIWCYLISSGHLDKIHGHLSNPYEIIKNQIESLRKEKCQFCSLVLVVLYDGTFDINLLTERDQTSIKLSSQKVLAILQTLGVDQDQDIIELQDSFQYLVGTYFRRYPTDSEYNILNDNTTKAVVEIYGPNHISLLLDHASSKFIREYVKYSCLGQNQAGNNPKTTFDSIAVITVPKRFRERLANRLLQDLQDGETSDVLNNPSFQNEEFRDYTLSLLLKSNPVEITMYKVRLEKASSADRLSPFYTSFVEQVTNIGHSKKW